ncbi:MAG: phosphoribosylanthranilate isomerase [Nitrospinales bacterium]
MPKVQSPVKIKICGITNLEDALLAVKWGADAVGFIFYKKSPRRISERTAKSIVPQLPPFVSRVGVFVDESSDRINRIVRNCRLDYAQLHGDESPGFCRKINCKVIKAVRLKNSKSLDGLSTYKVDGFLLDAFSPDMRGGTGQTCNWTLARKAKNLGPIILAGGLNPSNVADAILKTRPHGIDVCSGVEKSPGKKDPAKIKAFFNAVRTGKTTS